MKLSIITAVYNRESTVLDSLNSLHSQTYQNIEHIIVDGASTDNTINIIHKNRTLSTILFSEQDDGIYDALNKGILKSSGDVVGILHSDDFFANPNVLADVVQAFSDPSVDIVYGDLDYVSSLNPQKILRQWRSGDFKYGSFFRGWMPPHPTVFVRRYVFDKVGLYDLRYRISADYDWILRCFKQKDFHVKYLPIVLVKMRMGGESNKSFFKIIIKLTEDYSVLRKYQNFALFTLLAKNIRKLPQFLTGF